MKFHRFNVAVANMCGVNAAIIFDRIVYVVETSHAAGVNIKNGKPYIYTTVPDLLHIYPYMSESQIKTAITRLKECELIEDGGPVTVRYRRCRSYTLTRKGAVMYNAEY